MKNHILFQAVLYFILKILLTFNEAEGIDNERRI